MPIAMPKNKPALILLSTALLSISSLAQTQQCSPSKPADEKWFGGTSAAFSIYKSEAYTKDEAVGSVSSGGMIPNLAEQSPTCSIEGYAIHQQDATSVTIKGTMRCRPGAFGVDTVAEEYITYSKQFDPRSCGANYSYSASTQSCVRVDASNPVCPDPGADTGKPPECGEGNPIDRSTGNKFQSEVDYQGNTEFPLEFTRFYNSKDRDSARRPTLGGPWTGTFTRRLSVMKAMDAQNSGRMIVDRPDGSSRKFKQSGSAWISESGPDIQLVRVLDQGGNFLKWKFVGPDNIAEYFDAQGNLLSLQHPSGLTQTIEYGPNQLVIGATDSFGRKLSLEYEGFTLRKVTDPAGGVYRYAGSADQQFEMARVTYPDLSFRQYLYDESAYTPVPLYGLTGIVDESNKRFATFRYNEAGRAISTEHAGGTQLHQVTQNSDWSVTTTNPLGGQSVHQFQTINGVVRRVSQSQPAGTGCLASNSYSTFDAAGGLASSDDFNGTRTCYGNDLTRSLELSRVEGLSQSTACATVLPSNAALPTGSRKVSTQWHPDWRLKTRLAEPGKLTIWVYNGQPDPFNGNATAACAPSTALLGDGKPIAVLCRQVEQTTTDGDGHLGFTATLQAGVAARENKWTYNAVGQVLTHDGPRTDMVDVTTYTYYSDTTSDHLPGDLQSTTDPVGLTVQFLRYNRHGQLLESTEANGTSTVHQYDQRQRLTSSSTGGLVTTYTYDPTGLLKRVDSPDGTFVRYDYDDAHRLVAIYDERGTRVDYVLDGMGNRTSETLKDASGVLKQQLTRNFDALGRLQRVTGAE